MRSGGSRLPERFLVCRIHSDSARQCRRQQTLVIPGGLSFGCEGVHPVERHRRGTTARTAESLPRGSQNSEGFRELELSGFRTQGVRTVAGLRQGHHTAFMS